jgi:hypothetical protein
MVCGLPCFEHIYDISDHAIKRVFASQVGKFEGRFQLMELAEDFLQRAKHLEAKEAKRQKSKLHNTD